MNHNTISNHRKVSRERVIGISFVDILLQAVFVLLIALMVGYSDPVEKDNLKLIGKYGEIGKDLCHKINKDSVSACKEVIDNSKLISKSNNYSNVGEDLCRRLDAKSANECSEKAKALLLWPCLAPKATNSLTEATVWVVLSPTQIEFKGFTQPYIQYLENKNDYQRLNALRNIQNKPKRIFTPSEIYTTFDFIKENNCFHHYASTRGGRFTDGELSSAWSALKQLKNYSGQ